MKISVVALFAAALGSQAALRVTAQDVTVGEPVWAGLSAVPDEMPKAKGRLRPEFPEEMRNATEPGYVILTRSSDAAGKALPSSSVSTDVPYQKAVQDASREWTLSSAKRGGQSVEARVWVGIIFNPKSAAAKGPDASPRLLAVTPVVSAERPTPAGQPPIVRVKLAIDATGAVTRVQPVAEVKPLLAEAINVAVQAWHFAPARKAGQPVDAEIVIPVICEQPINAKAPKMVPPRRLSGESPKYPLAMRYYALEGRVLVDFEVDESGKVINPVITESDNPAFDEPALKALFTWKFQPATSDGKVVKLRMQVPIIFQIQEGGEKGIVRNEGSTDQSKLPVELRYDTPAKFRGILLPVYPAEAREARVSGKVAVAIMINPKGRVSDVKVLSADRPDLGLALTAAVEGFRFDPAYKDGKPVPHLLRFEYEFSRSNVSEVEYDLMAVEKKSPEKIVGSNKLDSPLVALSRRSPVFPVRLPAGITEGKAVIEFIVDKTGHARLPRVISATDEAFGYSGVQAVGTWLFAPPLVGGKPTLTRVQVPLVFSVKKQEAAKDQQKQNATEKKESEAK